MLEIIIPESELWDEQSEEFVTLRPQALQLEHSLVSISKWESKWNKPFLSGKAMTNEETMDYIKCMTKNTKSIDQNAYVKLTARDIKEITNYIEAPMTATKFYETKNRKVSRETVTSELIYYWMLSLGIPVEFEKWHLNRLLTLIKLCNNKNNPNKKKMSKREIMARNTELNEMRKKQLNTRG